MRIRRARDDELNVLLKHRVGMTTSMGWSDTQIEATKESTEKFLQKGLPANFQFFVVDIDGEIVGGCVLVVFDILPSYVNTSGKVAYVQNMFVNPEHRGKGIGKKIVQHMEHVCRGLKVSIIWLHATILGQPVYEGEGFEIWEPFYRKQL